MARFIADDPLPLLQMQRYGTSFNLDGIWGGNMYAGGAGAILPNKITSKHNIRYVPNMDGLDIVKKIRAQLDRNGYKDVEMQTDRRRAVVEDVVRHGHRARHHADVRTVPDSARPAVSDARRFVAGGYWPAYLFTNRQ